MRFFYGVTLGQAEIPERIPSADEVVRFLEAVPRPAPLRASEAVGLKVSKRSGYSAATIRMNAA